MRRAHLCALICALAILPLAAHAQDSTRVPVVVPAPGPTEGAYFEFQVERPVHRVSGPMPVYPPALRDGHVEGSVLVQFVVDTLGRPEMGTFKVLLSSHAMFADAVRDALPAMRFEPATIGGRHVRQVVQQPFTFAIP